MKFRKKAVVIEAITFDELVAYGLANGTNFQNGMAWSFQYEGQGITHHSDDCYLIPTLEGTMKFERGDMLITGVKGEIYPCKGDIFAMTYDPADVIVSSMKIDIDTSDIDAVVGKVEALQGFAAGFALDPLEQAIESTVRMLRDEHQQMAEVGAKEDTALCDRLGAHLDALLAIQIERVSSPVLVTGAAD